jgi:hypothetical protein
MARLRDYSDDVANARIDAVFRYRFSTIVKDMGTDRTIDGHNTASGLGSIGWTSAVNSEHVPHPEMLFSDPIEHAPPIPGDRPDVAKEDGDKPRLHPQVEGGIQQ